MDLAQLYWHRVRVVLLKESESSNRKVLKINSSINLP
jgi:hypothetical protein